MVEVSLLIKTEIMFLKKKLGSYDPSRRQAGEHAIKELYEWMGKSSVCYQLGETKCGSMLKAINNIGKSGRGEG
jgi:hypothetical protein